MTREVIDTNITGVVLGRFVSIQHDRHATTMHDWNDGIPSGRLEAGSLSPVTARPTFFRQPHVSGNSLPLELTIIVKNVAVSRAVWTTVVLQSNFVKLKHKIKLNLNVTSTYVTHLDKKSCCLFAVVGLLSGVKAKTKYLPWSNTD